MGSIKRHVSEVADGLGIEVHVDGSRPLDELTAAIGNACDQVEVRREPTVLVMSLGRTAPDSRAWPGSVTVDQVRRWERVVYRVQRQAAMNIAVAEGTCGGPTLDLLLAADYRIAGPELLVLLPINDGQFWPGMSVYWLAQQLGLARARQVVMWGDDISAERALDLGLIDQIADDFADAARIATSMMGRIADAELAVRRQLLIEAGSVGFDEALGTHLAACDRELRRLRAIGADSGDDS